MGLRVRPVPASCRPAGRRRVSWRPDHPLQGLSASGQGHRLVVEGLSFPWAQDTGWWPGDLRWDVWGTLSSGSSGWCAGMVGGCGGWGSQGFCPGFGAGPGSTQLRWHWGPGEDAAATGLGPRPHRHPALPQTRALEAPPWRKGWRRRPWKPCSWRSGSASSLTPAGRAAEVGPRPGAGRAGRAGRGGAVRRPWGWPRPFKPPPPPAPVHSSVPLTQGATLTQLQPGCRPGRGEDRLHRLCPERGPGGVSCWCRGPPPTRPAAVVHGETEGRG